MKICVSIFLLQVAASLAVYLPREGGKDVQELYNIHSAHLPAHIAPLNLTTGELKLFAGHSMQFLKTKCPAVPKDQLTQISKYIAKLVSKTNPAPERSPKFGKILTSLSSCAAHDKSAEDDEPQQSYFHSFLTPFIKIRGFFTPEEVKKDKEEIQKDPEVTPTTTPTPKDSDKVSQSTTVEPMKMMIAFDDSESDEFLGESTTKAATLKPKPRDDSPFFHTETYTNPDGSWNPIGWIKNIFHAVRDYFERIFGSDNVMVAGTTFRAKRDVSAQEEAPVKKETEKEDKSDDKMLMDKFVASMQKKEDQGKLAFLQLMDNLCRVYCAKCKDFTHIMEFKAASKALLNFIYSDSTGVELAAKHYLDPTVLEALNKC